MRNVRQRQMEKKNPSAINKSFFFIIGFVLTGRHFALSRTVDQSAALALC